MSERTAFRWLADNDPRAFADDNDDNEGSPPEIPAKLRSAIESLSYWILRVSILSNPCLTNGAATGPAVHEHIDDLRKIEERIIRASGMFPDYRYTWTATGAEIPLEEEAQ